MAFNEAQVQTAQGQARFQARQDAPGQRRRPCIMLKAGTSSPRPIASLATTLGIADARHPLCVERDGNHLRSSLHRQGPHQRAGRRHHDRARGLRHGEGKAPTPGQAHELALKAAETDATKRALATFGNPFGLALYDREQMASAIARRAADLPPGPWVLPLGIWQPAKRASTHQRSLPAHLAKR